MLGFKRLIMKIRDVKVKVFIQLIEILLRAYCYPAVSLIDIIGAIS